MILMKQLFIRYSYNFPMKFAYNYRYQCDPQIVFKINLIPCLKFVSIYLLKKSSVTMKWCMVKRKRIFVLVYIIVILKKNSSKPR